MRITSPQKQTSLRSKLASLLRWLVILLGLFFVLQIFNTVYEKFSESRFSDLIWLFAGDLDQDNFKRTNFLLLGEGGGKHRGADLTDVFLIASYSHQFQTLSLLSIPRDFWVELPNLPGMRLNKVYEHEKIRLQDQQAALKSTAWFAGEIVNLPIHYYLKIDFTGFRQLIDQLGGVQVLVETAINDPHFPCADMLNFCPFQLEAGYQILDGATALKFVRSRKTTSDFDRAARQQKLLSAIKHKAREQNILVSPSKMQTFVDLLQKHTETNLGLREFIKIGKLAEKFNQQNIAQIVLNDEPNLPGGLLYPPPREQFGGAAILAPVAKDLTEIHTLTKILFENPNVVSAKLAIEVLNGSDSGGLARKVAYQLNRYGLNALRANNLPAGKTPQTKIYFYLDNADTQATAQVIQNFIPGKIEKGPLELKKRGFDLTVVLGTDY